jgi:O-antigen ligase
VLGGFIAVVLPLIVLRIMNHESWKNRKQANFFFWFLISSVVLGLIALVLTFSRSAWVAGALGIFFAFLQTQKRESRIRNPFGLAQGGHESWKYILGAIFCFILYSLFMIHYSTSESVVVRAQLNASAISLIRQSPLLGVGLGNFLVKLPEVLPSRMIYFLQPVHNIYLLVLSEIGVVGIGLLLFMVGYFVKHESGIPSTSLRAGMNHGKKQNTSLFIIHYSLFTILLLGFVDHYPLTLQQGRLLLTILVSLLF